MTKLQWSVILLAGALFGALYLGFDTKPVKHKSIESQRALAATSTDISVLLLEAKKEMSSQESAAVLALETELNNAQADSVKTTLFKKLSSLWYSAGKTAVAGFYAEKAAELAGSEEAWSIAGTTYSICVQQEQQEKVKSFCTQQAIRALENAASLNPENLQHKVNLAVVYAENPPQDNPMKGVLMLVEMNKKFPENVGVLTQLGRLSIKTSQFDKAVQRLEEALAIEPDNPAVNCLLSRAYGGLGDTAKETAFGMKCEKLSSK